MIDLTNKQIEIVHKPEEVTAIFKDEKYPFPTFKKYRDYGEAYMQYIGLSLIAIFREDPKLQLRTRVPITDKALCKSAVYKIQVKDPSNNKGKSGGVRVVTLIVVPASKAFILDVLKHSQHEDDLTDEQKSFCTRITQKFEKDL